MSARALSTAPDGSLWVFGYGSLTWKVGFPFSERREGFVRCFARRFWQGSTDHRGVPETPGRVVTLVESAEDVTWGVAYRIAAEHADEALAYLDFRERGGYKSESVLFHGRDTPDEVPIRVLVYRATPDNPNYLGPGPLKDMAAQIATSVGPSGHNAEYLFRLAEAMRGIAPDHSDDHLFELEALVRDHLRAVNAPVPGPSTSTDAVVPPSDRA